MNEEIRITNYELNSLIGVAAAEVSYEEQMSDEEANKLMMYAARISHKLDDHLSGRRKFSEERIAFSLVSQMMCRLFGGLR
ncbi:MAG: hypothetical protein ACI4S2_01595 [Lachnospiraceae bacterium]